MKSLGHIQTTSSTLASLAMLKVDLDTRRGDYYDYLYPFIMEVLRQHAPDPVTEGVIHEHIREHLFLTTPVLYLSLVHAPFHVESRYSVPGRPFILIYTAVALIFLYTKTREHFRQKRRPAGSPPESPASP